MQPIKRFLEASFRIKILVPVIVVMGLLLVLTVLIVNQQFKQQAEQGAQHELLNADTRFHIELAKEQNNLRIRFRSLANQPKYRAVFELHDAKSIRNQLDRLITEEEGLKDEVEFVFFRPDDTVLAKDTESMLYRSKQLSAPKAILAGCEPVLKQGLQGETAADIIRINDRLYELIAIPIYNLDHDRFFGALMFGKEINAQSAQLFSESAHGQTVLVAGDTVIASSFPGAEQPGNLVALFKRLNSHGTGLDQLFVGGHSYFCASGKFPSLTADRSVGYLLFSSYDEQEALLGQTQKLLLTTIIIGILLGSLLVLFFINKATQPLRQLHDAAEAVGRGDFSHRVNIQSKDEFGELSHAFNQMTENIELSQSKLKQTVETLKTTQAQLIQSEKLSAVGEFVAGVAHELNNPLAAVMGFSEMLKDADVGEQHSRHLDLIFKSAQRCQKIVKSLLSFARRSQPERKPVTVNKLIEDVLEMIAYPLRTSNVKVITHFSPKLPLVLADGHQIQQVVLNIINNARQAIEAYEGSGRITVTTTADANCVRISIQDNGPGITPENLKRIFDPFFTTKEVGKGTGLGLSLCYGMIHEHGGNITVSSQPGEGATFTIELPVAEDGAWFETAFTTATATNGAGKPDLKEGAGKRILAVDDEESLLHMIKVELTRHQYEVTTVPNGETALRTMREKKFDAIICDLKMPGINGRQVYERLREESPETCRRMVFVTGDIIGDQLKTFLETEKRPCLTKPFSLGDLRAAVKDLIGKG
ncbi:MAG TPA: ATP-binding protein [Candidatus Acidoferrales bacterium]|jgi:two-component system NtrC family sensor kinase|nr:ATP-binding protein [Candidatus Acidoferrales bacterium]